MSHIPEAVYKTSVDWINNRSLEALGSFVLWSLDNILADFASQQGGAKGSKKGAQKTSSKSQVRQWNLPTFLLDTAAFLYVYIWVKTERQTGFRNTEGMMEDIGTTNVRRMHLVLGRTTTNM